MANDYRPSMSALASFGVPVVVTRPAPNDTPISTLGMWLLAATEQMPAGTDLAQRDARRVLVLPRVADGTPGVVAVPEVPRHTLIRAAEMAGDDEKDWKVDGWAKVVDPDHWRVYVREVSA